MEREKTLTILYSVSKIVLQTRVMQSMNKMLNNDFFGFFSFSKDVRARVQDSDP